MRYCIVLLACLVISQISSGQDEKGFFSLSEKNQKKFIKSISDKFQTLDEQITKRTNKTFDNLQRQEEKLYKRLAKKDSTQAKKMLEESRNKYASLREKLNTSNQKQLKEYLPFFDTVTTGFSFLNKYIAAGHPLKDKLKQSSDYASRLGSKMQIANEIKSQLKERKRLLSHELDQFGLVKRMKRLNKEMYYYQEQLKEYKSLLSDPSKIEKRALSLFRNSSAFNEFMKKNSMLAQLFKLPDDYGSPASLAGLQTQASVQALLAQRLAGAGANPQQYIGQQMNRAQSELTKLQNKVKKIGGRSSTDLDMPDNFKPNTQKTKPFMQRLEYGTNFQTQQVNSYFPTTTDVALTVGYKLNDKSVIGIGAAYKFGLGSIQRIRLTHEGAGLRSYIDWKLKGSIWISGGYEQNYLQRFSGFRAISNVSVWRQSALLGVTKKINVGKKKGSKVQLLYDFFYQKDNIRTQPLVFRVGYGF
jgi:hypothetical protein